MKDIDKLLQKNSIEDVNIPERVQNKIHYALNHLENKSSKINYLKRIITAFVSTILALLGSVTVYAAFGGTIGGIPINEWIGIKFSDQYEDYKVGVEGQEIIYNETKIELSSTVCDDGYTILEFDVKLSKEDKEYLKLGEKLITEQELEESKIREEKYKEQEMMGFKAGEEPYSFLVRYKDLFNTIRITFNENYNEIGKPRCNIIIDGEKHYVPSSQTVTKISEYEYKVYQLYFITDKELGDKTEFSLSLTANSLGNIADTDSYRKQNPEASTVIANRANNAREIELNGEFNIEVSKNKAVENTKVIKPDSVQPTYKHMTKKVEEIRITPLQIIAKVTTHIDNVSLRSLSSTRDKDYIGITEFKVYDNLGKELVSHNFEVKRTITYENGKVEEWSPGDIGTYKSFYNAQMDLVEYLIIEKKDDMDMIKIVPTVKEMDYSEENYTYNKKELESIEINLNR